MTAPKITEAVCKHTWMSRIAVVLVVCTLASLYGNWRAVRALDAMTTASSCVIDSHKYHEVRNASE